MGTFDHAEGRGMIRLFRRRTQPQSEQVRLDTSSIDWIADRWYASLYEGEPYLIGFDSIVGGLSGGQLALVRARIRVLREQALEGEPLREQALEAEPEDAR
jgi:hypothetical protein